MRTHIFSVSLCAVSLFFVGITFVSAQTAEQANKVCADWYASVQEANAKKMDPPATPNCTVKPEGSSCAVVGKCEKNSCKVTQDCEGKLLDKPLDLSPNKPSGTGDYLTDEPIDKPTPLSTTPNDPSKAFEDAQKLTETTPTTKPVEVIPVKQVPIETVPGSFLPEKLQDAKFAPKGFSIMDRLFDTKSWFSFTETPSAYSDLPYEVVPVRAAPLTNGFYSAPLFDPENVTTFPLQGGTQPSTGFSAPLNQVSRAPDFNTAPEKTVTGYVQAKWDALKAGLEKIFYPPQPAQPPQLADLVSNNQAVNRTPEEELLKLQEIPPAIPLQQPLETANAVIDNLNSQPEPSQEVALRNLAEIPPISEETQVSTPSEPVIPTPVIEPIPESVAQLKDPPTLQGFELTSTPKINSPYTITYTASGGTCKSFQYCITANVPGVTQGSFFDVQVIPVSSDRLGGLYNLSPENISSTGGVAYTNEPPVSAPTETNPFVSGNTNPSVAPATVSNAASQGDTFQNETRVVTAGSAQPFVDSAVPQALSGSAPSAPESSALGSSFQATYNVAKFALSRLWSIFGFGF